MFLTAKTETKHYENELYIKNILKIKTIKFKSFKSQAVHLGEDCSVQKVGEET